MRRKPVSDNIFLRIANRKKQQKEYRRKHKKQLQKYGIKYRHDNKEHRKKLNKRYYQKHKKHLKEKHQKYWKEHPGLNKKYRNTTAGKVSQGRKSARRHNMKFIPIFPNIFPLDIQVDWHHIDGYMFVAPIPKIVHLKTNKGKNVAEHLKKANLWVEFYYDMNPNNFLKEDIL